MLYRNINNFWALVGDAVDKEEINGWFAVAVFILTSPLWFPVWLASKLFNRTFF